jgi:hypothetical protein
MDLETMETLDGSNLEIIGHVDLKINEDFSM